MTEQQHGLTPEARQKIIVRTSVIGIIANVALAAFKAAVGLAANSIAVILDAVNNLTDVLSSVVTIVGSKLAGKKPDKDHPLGHGRYEYISAMAIVAIVLYAGISALIESIKKVIEPVTPDYSTTALIIIAAAIIVKIVLGRYVTAKGRACDSGSLRASGKDALFDAAISASVLAAAIIYIFTGFTLEAYVGIIISVVIIKAGIEMLREALDDILGHRPDSKLTIGIKRTACEDPDVLGAYDLLLESYGPDLTVGAMHVEVLDTMTAAQVDAMIRRLEKLVYERHRVELSAVSVYSRNTTDEEIIKMRQMLSQKITAHEGVMSMHGFYVDKVEKYLSFDVVISFSVPDQQATYDIVVEDAHELFPGYEIVVGHDIDLSD